MTDKAASLPGEQGTPVAQQYKNPYARILLPHLEPNNPTPGVIPGLSNWVYGLAGGGENLKAKSYAEMSPSEQVRYADQTVGKQQFGDWKAIQPEIPAWIEALDKQWSGVGQHYNAAQMRTNAAAVSPEDSARPGVLLEKGVIGPKGQAGGIAEIAAQMQRREMRARAIQNLASRGQWALLAGLIYGGVKNWRKLLVDDDLEKVSSVKQAVGPGVPTNPGDASITGLFERDGAVVGPAVMIGAGLGGYQLVDWLTDKARARALENKRKAAVGEFQRLFSSDLPGAQTKLASALDEAAKRYEQGDTTKQAWLDSLKDHMSPGVQAAAFGIPLSLAALSFIAARDLGLKESKKERAIALQAIRASQLGRPTQIEFINSKGKGDIEHQGYMTNRYQVPIRLPLARKPQEEQPEELDLTKLSALSFLVKKAMGNGTPGGGMPPVPGMGGVGAPQPPAAPVAPMQGMAPKQAPLPTGTMQNLWPAVKSTVGGGLHQMSEGAKDWTADMQHRSYVKTLQDPATAPALAKIMESPAAQAYVQKNWGGLYGANQWLQQAQTGTPNTMIQWLAGRGFNNPNTQGMGGWGNMLGMLMPQGGGSSWWNNMMGGQGGQGDQGNSVWSGLSRMAAPLTAGTPAPAPAPTTSG